MDNLNKVEAVTERDIDLLILEELNVNIEFSLWLYSSVTKNSDAPTCKGAWHSVSDASLGESDLIAIYENGIAILIENKIDAIAQPEQGIRYDARGKKGIQSGLWKNYFTCMIAPTLYLKKERDAIIYNANLSYEEISDWFSNLGPSNQRAMYKSYFIKEAIAQNRRGYTIKPDERVTEFWSKYWELATNQFPELEMKNPGIKPAKSDWPEFRPPILDRRFSIFHKLERGDVDLQIAGAVDKLEFLQNLLTDLEVNLVAAGKSAAIRFKTDPIDRFSSFESQKNIAIDGMTAASKLLEIGIILKDRI